ncbi:hypothetical protein BASA81_000265 [Batrachochytrium salamandrivorans]|nr:hypothetical protein BASA81_000265 [Batrachochytrium salamandrivorans]
MSRSSEIRSQRYKASRQRQQLLLEASQATREGGEGGGEEYGEMDDLQQPLPDEPIALCQRVDDKFNLHPFVVEAMQVTPYFQRCQQLSRFSDLLLELETRVDHVEPFTEHAGSVRVASNAFCLLYRAMEMNLSKRQMHQLLAPSSPARVRAVAALYLRYVAKPEDLWDWLESMLWDFDTQIAPYNADLEISLGAWTKSLLDVRYCGTMLPRLPSELEKTWRARLAKRFVPGAVCEAKYDADGQWYSCRIDRPSEENPSDEFWITFLPEHEFGDQALVRLANLR